MPDPSSAALAGGWEVVRGAAGRRAIPLCACRAFHELECGNGQRFWHGSVGRGIEPRLCHSGPYQEVETLQAHPLPVLARGFAATFGRWLINQ